jgi:hypothetical protein
MWDPLDRWKTLLGRGACECDGRWAQLPVLAQLALQQLGLVVQLAELLGLVGTAAAEVLVMVLGCTPAWFSGAAWLD